MKLLKHFSILILINLILGCASDKPSNKITIWGTIDEARAHFEENFNHVILVRINSENIKTEKRNNPWSTLHYKGTVEKVYKGTVEKVYKGSWKKTDKVTFAIPVDCQVTSPINPKGSLMFLLINLHENKNFVLEAGDYLSYSPDMERLIKQILKKQNE